MYRVSKSSTMACGVSSPPPWDFQLQSPPEGTWHTCGAPLPSSTHLGPDSHSFHVYLDSQNPRGSCELAHRRDLRQGQLEGRAISSRYFTHVGYFFLFGMCMWCTCVCAYARRRSKLVLSLFLICYPLYLSRQGLLLDMELANSCSPN